MNRAIRTAVALALVLTPAFGYIRAGYTEAGGAFIPYRRIDTKGIQFYINNLVVPGATSGAIGAQVKVVSDNSDPVTAIREAAAMWNRVPGADIKFLPLKATDALHKADDGKNVILFASNVDDLSALGFVAGKAIGAIGVTVSFAYADKGKNADGVDVDKGDISDSDILLNPAGTAADMVFSSDGSTAVDIQTVLAHELGHALGANHTGLLGAAMFPYLTVDLGGGNKVPASSARLLSSDDQAFVVAVYPAAGVARGTLSGKVTASGGSAVKAALVTILDTATGVTLGTISGADGTYSQQVPPGNYMVYAEPFNGIVGAGNIIGLDPAQVTTGFQPTFRGGSTAPTLVQVDGGASAVADFTVAASGATALTAPLAGFAAAGGTGGISGVNGLAGPAILSSGQSRDLVFVGGGFDATTTVQVFGPGISVRAGSIRVDTSLNSPLGPIIRATLDITARQTPAMATLMLTKGGSTLAFSGYFVIVPPKPVFTSKSVVNAASYVGLSGDGVVSPGGLYSIYAATGSALGPESLAQNGPYDGYGKLANSLSGVSVTFDGVLAPMFLSFSGQLNVQVPFEVAGKKTTVVQVNYNGSLSDKISVPVTPSQPAFFTITPIGTDSIAGNQDFTLNSSTNPEARGRVVSIYGTGLGKLSYDVPTGAGAGGPPAGYTGNNTCVLGGSKSVSVAFTGWTPSAVGLGQWSLVIPSDSPTGAVSVKCTDINGASTQVGTLYIK